MECYSLAEGWCPRVGKNPGLLAGHCQFILSAFLSQMLRLYWAPYKSTLLETLSLKMSHSGLCVLLFLMALFRLCEALLSFLDFSDKKANTAIGLLTDLALEER